MRGGTIEGRDVLFVIIVIQLVMLTEIVILRSRIQRSLCDVLHQGSSDAMAGKDSVPFVELERKADVMDDATPGSYVLTGDVSGSMDVDVVASGSSAGGVEGVQGPQGQGQGCGAEGQGQGCEGEWHSG